MTASAQDRGKSLEGHLGAEDLRASAAEHRARAHELRASANGAAELDQSGNDAYLHAGVEERLAEVAELRATALDARARGELQLAAQLEREAATLTDVDEGEAELHGALSDAAMARARVREQLRLAGAARRAAIARGAGAAGDVHLARAESHEAWAELHARTALAHQLHAQGLAELSERSLAEAEELRRQALAAEKQLLATEREAETQAGADPSAGTGSPS